MVLETLLMTSVGKKVDADLAVGVPLHPLAGIPIAVKDNICYDGVPSTAGSQLLGKHVSPYDADVILYDA